MGKSNNLHNKIKKIYEKENNLNNFLTKNEIQILENINDCFIDQFINFFSIFIKNSVKLSSCNIRVASGNFDKEIIKNLRCLNLIEILPYKKQTFVIFSYNFLSVIIDLLFGGCGSFSDKNKKIGDITSTESFINQKIIKFIINTLSDIYKEYFSPEVDFISIKTLFDLKSYNFNYSTVFLIHYFNFNINNIEVCFNILIPISILKYINNKKSFLISNNNEKIDKEKEIENKISLNEIYNVELNIVYKIIDTSISCDKIYNLSPGDVLSIKKPNKIIGFIEDQPIFFGNYKRFNEQTIFFIEEFIEHNLESNQDKEYSNG